MRVLMTGAAGMIGRKVAERLVRDGALGGRETIMSGFQGSDGKRWGRPVAAVQGADGAVYVSDDLADAVYRLTPPA